MQPGRGQPVRSSEEEISAIFDWPRAEPLPMAANVVPGLPNGHQYGPSSFPTQQQQDWPLSAFPNSYAGTPSPLLFHNAQIPLYPNPQFPSLLPPASRFSGNQLAESHFSEMDLLALQMSLEAQGIDPLLYPQPYANQYGSNGGANAIAGPSSSRSSVHARSQTVPSHPLPIHSPRQTSITPTETFQRPLPPSVRRNQPSSLSNSSSLAASPVAPSPYLNPQYHSIPNDSRRQPPASPRNHPPIDYSFNSLETDLDSFNSAGQADFAVAAAAALASVSTSRTGTAANSPTTPDDRHLLDSPFATLPTRSTGPSNAPSPKATASSTVSTTLSPPSFSPSPSSFDHSSIFDDEPTGPSTGEDPIAAQAWRLINKAKATMPNGARMENLTWRLMSMTLKKRRAEAEAAQQEAEALIAAEKVEELARATTAVTLDAGKEKIASKAVEKVKVEAEDRGRRGRGSTAISTSVSPSAEEEQDGMDWRAKSQSRSRSRAPDAMMDWRAQSRSRSRAPAFRVPLPLAPVSTYDNASAQHLGSRFFGDTGGFVTPAEEKAHHDLVSSLGLDSGNGDFTSAVSDYDQFTAVSRSTNGAGPSSAVEDSLNHLINLQSLATSPITSAAPSPWIHERNGLTSPSTSPAKTVLPAFSHRKEEKRSVGVVLEENEDEYAFLPSIQPPARSNGASPQVQQSGDTKPPIQPAGLSAPSTSQPNQFGNAFPYSTSPASGLSLARPATQQLEPQYINPRAGSLTNPSTQLFSSSIPTHNFVNPPSFFDGLNDANQLRDFYSSPVDPYSLPYLNGFDLRAPTHIDPSQLNGNTSYSPYDLPPSAWNIYANPLANGTLSPTHTVPSSPALQQYPGHPLSHTPVDHSAAFLGPKTLSSSDLTALGKVKPLSAPVSRKNSTLVSDGSRTAPAKPTNAKSTTAKGNATADDGTETRCINCNTTVTTLWRRDAEGKPLCNACGLFKNLHGVERPAALWSLEIKKRNRSSKTKNDTGATKKQGANASRPARRNSANTGAAPAAARAGAIPYSVRANPHQQLAAQLPPIDVSPHLDPALYNS